MGKRELVALLDLSSWCLVMVERLFLPLSWGCLRFVIVVFPDHTHLLFCFSMQRTSDTLIGYLLIFQILPKTSLCIRYLWCPFELDA